MITDEARGELVAVTERGIILVGKVRAAWVWLREATVPGGQPWAPSPVATEEQLDRMTARAFAERTYKAASLRVGLSALAPMPSAANLAAVDTRATLERMLPELAAELFYTVTGGPLPLPPDPTVRRHPARCRLCLGRGALPIPSTIGEDWIRCPVIERCRSCRSPLLCACDPADARIHHALTHIATSLPQLRDLHQARDAVRELDAAYGRARNSSHAYLPEDRLRRVECPACHGRTLRLDAESKRQAEWGITCVSNTCLCTGPGCPCGRVSTYRGAAHQWLAAHHGWRQLEQAMSADSARRLAELVAARLTQVDLP